MAAIAAPSGPARLPFLARRQAPPELHHLLRVRAGRLAVDLVPVS